MGGETCRLCQRQLELRNSHILPEFLYQNMYDEIHRTLLISRDGEQVVQKGIRERLLCQKCETKLSKYEKYTKDLIQEIPNFPCDNELGILYSDNINYSQLKLFQLSMLWRASVSRHEAFAQVKLGPHEDKTRRMLDEENPGRTTDYGCLMSITLDTELLHKVLQSPTRFTKKLFGHNVYKFPTGNLTWVFVVTSHHVNANLWKLFLQESGLLRVMLSRYDEQAEIIKIAKNLQRLGRGN